MKKTELYLQHHRIENMESHIWDRWLNYKLEQKKVDRRNDGWDRVREVAGEIPNIYNWNIKKDHMCFQWVDDNGEEQEELVPLDVFVDDLDKQPDLEMLWHCGYHDGPLSGVAKYEGELVWFDCVEMGDWGEDEVRSFQLHRLSKEDEIEILRRHRLFNEMVGYHSNHHPDEYKEYACRDKKLFNQFYEISKTWPALNLEKGEKLGVFAWHQFKYYTRPR